MFFLLSVVTNFGVGIWEGEDFAGGAIHSGRVAGDGDLAVGKGFGEVWGIDVVVTLTPRDGGDEDIVATLTLRGGIGVYENFDIGESFDERLVLSESRFVGRISIAERYSSL